MSLFFMETHRQDIIECSICQENITPLQNIVSLGRCRHSFHAICIQTWATVQTTCPLCRAPFSEAGELRRVIPTLMAMAVWMPIEDQIQRISLAFAFIRLVLNYFPNSVDFNTHKNMILQFSENLTLDNFKIPLLCYTRRSDLYKQAYYFKTRFHALTGLSLERHEYVRQWKNRILMDYRGSMFFFHKTLWTPGVHYYQQPQEPHTS